MGLRSYQDLIGWKKSMTLVSGIYRCTQSFPKEEIYGLTSQLRRAAVSIPSNIAEGKGVSAGENSSSSWAMRRGRFSKSRPSY